MSFLPPQIFYRALRDVQPGEELTVWYSNPLAQWFDIPVTATPTHDEKGTAVATPGPPHPPRFQPRVPATR